MSSIHEGQIFINLEDRQMEAMSMQGSRASESDGESNSFALSSIVKVIVGKRGTVYRIHKATLVKESPFFAACLRSGMVEQHQNKVVLPEDKCSAFNYVIDWVYSGQVSKLLGPHDAMSAMEAYLLADKYCMTRLQNALIESLKEYWDDKVLHPEIVGWAVANLHDTNCTLYRLITDQFAWDVVNHSYSYQAESEMGASFDNLLRALVTRGTGTKLLWTFLAVKKGGRVGPKQKKGCAYHFHGEDELCDV